MKLRFLFIRRLSKEPSILQYCDTFVNCKQIKDFLRELVSTLIIKTGTRKFDEWVNLSRCFLRNYFGYKKTTTNSSSLFSLALSECDVITEVWACHQVAEILLQLGLKSKEFRMSKFLLRITLNHTLLETVLSAEIDFIAVSVTF